jgi:hypothetical protein
MYGVAQRDAAALAKLLLMTWMRDGAQGTLGDLDHQTTMGGPTATGSWETETCVDPPCGNAVPQASRTLCPSARGPSAVRLPRCCLSQICSFLPVLYLVGAELKQGGLTEQLTG